MSRTKTTLPSSAKEQKQVFPKPTQVRRKNMKLVKLMLSALFVVAICAGCPKEKPADPPKKAGEEAKACTCGKADCEKCKAAKDAGSEKKDPAPAPAKE